MNFILNVHTWHYDTCWNHQITIYLEREIKQLFLFTRSFAIHPITRGGRTDTQPFNILSDLISNYRSCIMEIGFVCVWQHQFLCQYFLMFYHLRPSCASSSFWFFYRGEKAELTASPMIWEGKLLIVPGFYCQQMTLGDGCQSKHKQSRDLFTLWQPDESETHRGLKFWIHRL